MNLDIILNVLRQGGEIDELLLIGGGAAVYFLKFRKNKPKTGGTTDLDDYDYGEEDETEYEGEEENE